MAMAWQQLLTTKRYGHEHISPREIGRSHFHKDHDRIIFSSAFRRLSRKTQVHPLASNDHIHTRLTHSIEVGSVGRTLGIRVGEMIADELPHWAGPHDLGTIVQSACLAHDIGNPPFGHAGEFAIRDWFRRYRDRPMLADLTSEQRKDLETFEGNAQGFRVITQIENNLFDGGLRLTSPTLGAFLKYPWTAVSAGERGKFSCYQTELPLLESLAEQLGLVETGPQRWCRHPLSYLMEAADDICYAIMDLEDAIELSILTFEDIQPVLEALAGDVAEEEPVLNSSASARRKISALRGKAMERMVGSALGAFMAHYEAIMAGRYEGVLLADGDPAVQTGLQQAKTLARDRVFPDTRKTELEVGAYSTLGTLLDAFCEAVYEHHLQQGPLSYRSEKIVSLMGIHCPAPEDSLYHSYMRALDFISGMTDNYAAYLARQIGGLS